MSYVMIENVPDTRDGNDEDLEAIHNEDWKDAVDVGDLRVHDGDLAIDGDFDASNGALLVNGNLTVTGTVGLDETGSLIVTGNLTCRNLSCEGNLEIQGDTKVAGTVFGYYEAGISFFEGTLSATLLLQGNHAFELDTDKLDVGTHLRFDNFRGLSIGTADQAKAVLSDEAFRELGNLIGLSDQEKTGSYDKLLRTSGFLR